MKKQTLSKNYLERIPMRAEHLDFLKEDYGLVTLLLENKGLFNRIAQRFFKKPKVSQIHLDEMGSFLWQLIDGETDLLKMGEGVREKFGETAEPLYERLAKYFQILDSYGFIRWKE